jgi:hypothetical protein
LKQRTYEQIGGFDVAMYEKVLVQKREACAILRQAVSQYDSNPSTMFCSNHPRPQQPNQLQTNTFKHHFGPSFDVRVTAHDGWVAQRAT